MHITVLNMGRSFKGISCRLGPLGVDLNIL